MPLLLRRAEVCARLGITDEELDKLTRSGVLRPVKLREGQVWRYFLRSQVDRLVEGSLISSMHT